MKEFLEFFASLEKAGFTIPIGFHLERAPINEPVTYGVEPIKAAKAFGFAN